MTDNRSDSTTTTAGTSRSGGRLSGAAASVKSAASTARSRVSDAYGTARERASSAYSTTRQSASDGLDTAPLAALAGGLALGVIAGALLPRTRREAELLGPVGRRVNETAREAFYAAREAGKEQIGLNKDAAKSQVQSLLDKATTAAKTAGEAAAQKVRSKAKGG